MKLTLVIKLRPLMREIDSHVSSTDVDCGVRESSTKLTLRFDPGSQEQQRKALPLHHLHRWSGVEVIDC